MAISDPPFNSLLGGVVSAPDMWAHINKDEIAAQMMRDIQQANLNQNELARQGVVHNFPPASLPANNITLANRAREMFLKRMGGIRNEMKIAMDDFLQCHIYNDQVYVFYCFGGRHGVTLEPIDLFPSDQLITQFRLVLT
jgi:hypothetical protein